MEVAGGSAPALMRSAGVRFGHRNGWWCLLSADSSLATTSCCIWFTVGSVVELLRVWESGLGGGCGSVDLHVPQKTTGRSVRSGLGANQPFQQVRAPVILAKRPACAMLTAVLLPWPSSSLQRRSRGEAAGNAGVHQRQGVGRAARHLAPTRHAPWLG